MNGLFAYDGPIFKDMNGNYGDAVITDEVLSRYLEYVDHLYVLIRVEKINIPIEESKFIPILSKSVTIVEIPNLNTVSGFIHKSVVIDQITKVVQECDMFFLRIPGLICNAVANICNKLSKRYLVEVGGDSFDAFWNHSMMGKLIAPYMFYSQKRTVFNASYATYVTDYWLQKRYPTKGVCKPASNVYLRSFDTEVINSRISRYSQNKIQTLRIGTLASVDVRSKGQDLIIKALGRLKKKGIILIYELVGTGDPTYLSQIAQKNDVLNQVVFVGAKRHEDIWSWLDTIDIYAQPSKQEGLPRAVIEAMNRGCICIGSKVAGIPELLEEDELFKVGNVNDICDVLLRIIQEKDYSIRITRNFNKSKKYALEKLNENRRHIFSQYKNSLKI